MGWSGAQGRLSEKTFFMIEAFNPANTLGRSSRQTSPSSHVECPTQIDQSPNDSLHTSFANRTETGIRCCSRGQKKNEKSLSLLPIYLFASSRLSSSHSTKGIPSESICVEGSFTNSSLSPVTDGPLRQSAYDRVATPAASCFCRLFSAGTRNGVGRRQ